MSLPPDFTAASKDQAARSGRFGKGLDPAVIEVSVSVEDHLLNPLFEALFREQFPDLLRRLHVSGMTKASLEFRADRRSADHGDPRRVDDRLGIEMLEASKNVQARPFRCPPDTAPHPLFPLQSRHDLPIFQKHTSLRTRDPWIL